LCFLDITASSDGRDTIVHVVEEVAKQLFIPLTVGGGIRKIDDISRLLNVGCDKVSLNSSAVDNPNLIYEAANKFGSQCIVVAIDVKKNDKGSYNVFVHGGRKDTGLDAIQWAKRVYDLGAGEILLTSMDSDGTKAGYDLNITSAISNSVQIPVIASGGAGTMQHILQAFQNGADAALAASIFHYKEIEILKLKEFLRDNGIGVRI